MAAIWLVMKAKYHGRAANAIDDCQQRGGFKKGGIASLMTRHVWTAKIYRVPPPTPPKKGGGKMNETLVPPLLGEVRWGMEPHPNTININR